MKMDNVLLQCKRLDKKIVLKGGRGILILSSLHSLCPQSQTTTPSSSIELEGRTNIVLMLSTSIYQTCYGLNLY